MAKYRLSEYEDNRYHDSYGYLLYWNTETNKIESVMHWSTAFAGGSDMSEYLMPTKEIVEQAIAYWAKQLKRMTMRAIIRAHYNPTDKNHLNFGDKVVFKQQHRSRKIGRTIAVGETAEVVGVSLDTYKTRSYSSFDWFNVTVRLLDGKMVTIPMEKLRKAGRPNVKPSEVLARSLENARSCHFRTVGAWDSENWALKVLNDTLAAG